MTNRPSDIDPTALCPGCFQKDYPRNRCSACGFRPSSQTHLLALPIGSLLGDAYFVGNILGRPGGFGITYLAWDRVLQMRVAIKEYLPRELAHRDTDSNVVTAYSQSDEELYQKGLQQFLQEARLLAQFNHPNIVRVRTYIEENATAYLVMDFIEGRTLDEFLHLRGGRLKEDLAVRLLLPVLDGLRALHSKGIVHRDIKPQNIYLAEDKIPVLLDFGAARSILGSHGASLSVIGTPGFMPPEQFHGNSHQGPWTDVYGLAATLYYLLEGDLYSKLGVNATSHNTDTKINYLRSSPHLRLVLQKALADHPADRYQQAEELLNGLLSTLERTVPQYSGQNGTTESSKGRNTARVIRGNPIGWVRRSAVQFWQFMGYSTNLLRDSYSRYKRKYISFIAIPLAVLLIWLFFSPSEATKDSVPLMPPPPPPTEDPPQGMANDKDGQTGSRDTEKEESKHKSLKPNSRRATWAPSADAIVEDVLQHDYRFQTGYTPIEVKQKLKEIRKRPRILDETISRWKDIPLPLFNGRTEDEIRHAIIKRF